MWATLAALAEHVGSFLLGVLVGLGLASRYRIVRIGGAKDQQPP